MSDPVNLQIYSKSVQTVFGLAGSDENSATYALGWVLHHVKSFRRRFVEQICGQALAVDDAIVELQRLTEEGGFTDIELIDPGKLHIVIEAKVGFVLPTEQQLSKYGARIKGNPLHGHLVSISGASRQFATRNMQKMISGIPVSHFSWIDILELCEHELKGDRNQISRLWLAQLMAHLRSYAIMTNARDNSVFSVVLSNDEISPGYTWKDVVLKHNSYFHPYGKRWPRTPPNYIGFRYDGALQSIHHVESAEIVDDLKVINAAWPSITQPHVLYSLGSAILSQKKLPNGRIYPSALLYVAIDTLLSGDYQTVYDAVQETKRRNA